MQSTLTFGLAWTPSSGHAGAQTDDQGLFGRGAYSSGSMPRKNWV